MKQFISGVIICLILGSFLKAQGQDNHDYLEATYDAIHGSPMQEKFRRMKPMPTGVVYLQQPGEGEAEMRAHFRTMKQLGFNSLKQIMVTPEWTIEQVQLIALEEGIVPWWYGQGGWEDITPELMAKLSIDRGSSVTAAMEDPRMIQYQNERLKQRILRVQEMYQRGAPYLYDHSTAYEPTLGGRGFDLSEEGVRLLTQWVKQRYQTIEQLNAAYNLHHVGVAKNDTPFESWDDFKWENIGRNDYRHLMDILEFKVQTGLKNIQARCERLQQFDPHAPFRGGGEMGLFLPQAWYGVDLERIAGLMTSYGSFYPSMHLAWHYNEVDHELVRPFYMQSSHMNDYFKGGWTASWEATGGPQQFSGYKEGNGFAVDAGVMTQFLLSNLAAGYRGFGLWTWNARTAGWETGEYALLDRNQQVTPRAIKVGQIARAMEAHREELWDAKKEPIVGVFQDWTNEALWAALSNINRDSLKMMPIQSRIGVSRALINHNIPFEYVTAKDLQRGLGGRYRVIYLPAMLAVSSELQQLLEGYVAEGGRLVMDLPSWWFDDQGAIVRTGKGTAFERLFGATLDDFQFSGVNLQYQVSGLKVHGFVSDNTLTRAHEKARYNRGGAAVTEHRYQKGTAVLLGYEASKMCFRPGNEEAEARLIQYALGDYRPYFTCDKAIVYRLASPQADHYFFINDKDEDVTVSFTSAYGYKKVVDALSGEAVDASRIQISASNGRWLRMLR